MRSRSRPGVSATEAAEARARPTTRPPHAATRGRRRRTVENLSNLGFPQLQGGLLDTISRFVGGGTDATKKTLEAALPTSMLAIAERGSTEGGAGALLDGLKSGKLP